MEEDEYLDHSAGNGSGSELEGLIDEESLRVHDGRSKMETSFNPDEADKGILMSDGKRRPFSYLHRVHEGHYEDDFSERSDQASIRRDAVAFCNHVECTPYQQKRVLFHVEEMRINDFGSWNVEKVICALIAHVANRDDRWIQREDAFQDLLESLDTDRSEIKRVTRKAQEKL